MELERTAQFNFLFWKLFYKIKDTKKALNKNEIPNEIEQARCKINNMEKNKLFSIKVNEIDLLTYGGFVKEKKVEI